METLWRDILCGTRVLAKRPGFAAVAILTLALGIGANSAIFSLVDGVLLKPLPYPKPDQVVRLWEKPPDGTRNLISTLNYRDWKQQSASFQSLSAATSRTMTLSGAGEPEVLNAYAVSASYFDLLGHGAALGRTFAPDEDQLGKEKVVILANALWQRRFGGDPHVIGRTITLDGSSYIVIGVLAAGSVWDRTWSEIWVPLVFQPQGMSRNFHWLAAYGRLRDGVTLKQAKAEMDSIAARIAGDYPSTNKGWGVTLDKYSDVYVNPQLRVSLWVLFAAVGAVLLIACANLANLMLARAAEREREVAIRSALGAGRARLIRQFLTENMLLAILGGLAGLGLGFGIMRAIKLWTPPLMLPQQADVRMDLRALLFTIVLAVFTGLLFGMAPALAAARQDVSASLKESGNASAGRPHSRLRDLLIVAEVALSFVCLTGAGLLIRSFARLMNLDLGVDATNVITMRLPMSPGQNTDSGRLRGYIRQLHENVSAIPGVRDVAVTSALPLRGWGWGMPFLISGQAVDWANRPNCFFKMVSPAYFRALGMKLKAGRGLSETDVNGTQPVTVISETMANRYFKGRNPIGQQILIRQILPGKRDLGPDIAWQIVGVVSDERVDTHDAGSPGVYVTYDQSPVEGTSLVVRAVGDPSRLVRAIQQAVWDVNKNQALTDIDTLEQIKSDSLASDRFRTLLLGSFAFLALVLAIVGIYGVISYSVAQRTREMAIRSALGARAVDLLRLVVGKAMFLASLGLTIGLAASLGLMRLLASLLFETPPTEPVTLLAVAGLLGLAALIASYVPARPATKIDPMLALRYE